MVEQVCPQCRAGNPLDNSYCGQCGTRLDDTGRALVARNNSPLTIGRDRFTLSQITSPSLQQVGRAVAVSLVALAAEAGLSWLRRRVEQLDDPTPSTKSTAIVPRESPLRQGRVTTIFSRNITEIWENGRLKGHGIEERVWQIDE